MGFRRELQVREMRPNRVRAGGVEAQECRVGA